MKPFIVFSTDFGEKDGAVSSMYGVVKSIDPTIGIYNLSHQVTKFSTWSASYRLYQTFNFWPVGSIFVSVIDPGVGTPRKASVAKTANGYYIVTPDNGTLTHVKKHYGIEAIREIDESRNRLKGKGTEDVAIFHGRDLFAYCAGKLAAGLIDFEGVGPEYSVDDIICHEIDEPVITSENVTGRVDICCPNFGCVWTNINYHQFIAAGYKHGDRLNVVIKHKDEVKFEGKVLFHKSFGYVEKGEPIIYNNELNNLDISLNQASMAEKYGIGFGSDWSIKMTK